MLNDLMCGLNGIVDFLRFQSKILIIYHMKVSGEFIKDSKILFSFFIM